jgi:hypothetical protein
MADFGAEDWRGAPGFEAYYQVSSLGRVKSLRSGAVMTPVPDKDGYPRVIFRINGKHYTRKVHRLVCEAFNGPPNALHNQVDHIDADRANAKAVNLRWVSRGENLHFCRYRLGPDGRRTGNVILDDDAVREIRSGLGAILAKDLAEKFGVTAWTIYSVWKRKRWGHVS